MAIELDFIHPVLLLGLLHRLSQASRREPHHCAPTSMVPCTSKAKDYRTTAIFGPKILE